MNKTKIEWTDYSWNPIKGKCPVGCFYCYARRMYQRFKWNPEINFNPNDIDGIALLKKPSKIFVCSTIEIFHPKIDKYMNITSSHKIRWRDIIFDTIESYPQHTFQILTKFPQNIDREMPENIWIGTTITGSNDYDRKKHLLGNKAKIYFISLEPFLNAVEEEIVYNINWLIIGRLTGYGKKYDPKKSWIDLIIREAKKANIPIFIKNNLKEIMGSKLIQEFPKE